jgi:hypothetical protein
LRIMENGVMVNGPDDFKGSERREIKRGQKRSETG